MSYFDFGGFCTSSKGEKFFRRIPHDVDDECPFIERKRKEYRNTDIYRSVFDYETDNLDTSKIRGPFYLDFDMDNLNDDNYISLKRQVGYAYEFIQGILDIPCEFIEIFFSGKKGFHILISPVIFGFDFEEANKVVGNYKAFADFIKWKIEKETVINPSCIDMQIYDKRRVLRIENSINSKSGLYKIRLSKKELHNLTLEELKELAKTPRDVELFYPPYLKEVRSAWDYIIADDTHLPTSERKERKKLNRNNNRIRKDLMPCIKEIMLHGVDKGSRNNTTVAFASSLLQNGYDTDEVLETLLEWNDMNNPPLSENEITVTLISANKMLENDKHYGCTSIKNLGLCVKKCKFARNVK